MNLIGKSEDKRKVFKIPYSLTPSQSEIDKKSTRFTIVRAGRKFGKTFYARKKCLEWLGPPNSVIWYLSPTYKMSKLIAWSDFKRMIPFEAMAKKPNDTDLTITLKNGSELYLMGSDDPDSLRGPAPTGVIFEEAALHKREVWHEVIRPNLLVHKAPALFISTPKGYNWFKDLEDEALRVIADGNKEWSVFHYTVYDNPHIDQPEIEQARKECDNDNVWRQEYMAEYESSVGRVFSAFSDARHMGLVPAPKGASAYRSIDWGMRDDTACLWAYVQNKKLMVYREHAENNLPASTQAGIILGKTPGDENVVASIIGHDANKQDSEMRGLTVLWHFANAGIRPIRAGSRDKKSSRALIQQLLQEDRIVIDKSCQRLRKQLLAYEWKDTVMEKTVDGNDDLVDSLHSMCELLQFELFLGAKRDDRMRPMSEIMKDVERENLKLAEHRFPIPGNIDPNSGIVSESSIAGYIR